LADFWLWGIPWRKILKSLVLMSVFLSILNIIFAIKLCIRFARMIQFRVPSCFWYNSLYWYVLSLQYHIVFKGQFTTIAELQLLNQNNSVCHHVVINFHGTNFYTSYPFFESLSLYNPHVLYLMTLMLFLQLKHVLKSTYIADCIIEKQISCSVSFKCTVETITSAWTVFPILYNSTFAKHQNFRHCIL
jgi:hypothetical protein